eukprot:4763958-Pleurochrysis_carterae.AAC.4
MDHGSQTPRAMARQARQAAPPHLNFVLRRVSADAPVYAPVDAHARSLLYARSHILLHSPHSLFAHRPAPQAAATLPLCTRQFLSAASEEGRGRGRAASE